MIPEIADEVEQLYRRVMSSGEPVLNVEVQGMTAAEPGVERHWICNYFPLRSGAGIVVGVGASLVIIRKWLGKARVPDSPAAGATK